MHGVAIVGAVIAGCSALEAVVWSRDRARRAILIAAACILAWIRDTTGLALLAARCAGRRYGARSPDSSVTDRRSSSRNCLSGSRCSSWSSCSCERRPLYNHTIARHARAGRDRFGLCGFTPDVVAQRSSLFPGGRAGPFADAAARGEASSSQSPHHSRRPLSIGLAAVVAAACVWVAWWGGGMRLGWKPMSAPAIEAVRSCQGPLFNGFADGGVIACVRARASHLRRQPRCGSVPLPLLLRGREADLSGNYRLLFEDFEIGCAAVAAGSPIARQLAADGIFRQQYADDQWVVFARATR